MIQRRMIGGSGWKAEQLDSRERARSGEILDELFKKAIADYEAEIARPSTLPSDWRNRILRGTNRLVVAREPTRAFFKLVGKRLF